jgi:hypothetical protein
MKRVFNDLVYINIVYLVLLFRNTDTSSNSSVTEASPNTNEHHQGLQTSKYLYIRRIYLTLC